MATTRSSSRKAWQEQQIASAFLPWYNLAKKSCFSVPCSGIPPEPDVLCQDSKTRKEIGIEATSAYYGRGHAKAEWERTRGKTTASYQITKRDSVMNAQVLEEVRRLVQGKSQKSYSHPGRLLLVIFLFPWRVYLEDLEQVLACMPVPPSQPFNEIYVASQHDEIYCLSPNEGRSFPIQSLSTTCEGSSRCSTR